MKKIEAVILVCLLLCSTFPFTFSPSPVSATGAHDVEDEIIIGEIETDNLPAYFSDITGGISDVVFSNDSNYVAVGGDDGYIFVYNTSNLSLAATLGYGDGYYALDFSDDDAYLVGSLDIATGGASIFWTSNWTLKQNVTDPTNNCKDIDFSPNGTWLAVSSSDQILYIYDVADFSLNTSWDTNQNPSYDTVQFTEDSQYLVYGKFSSTNITVYYTSNWSIKTDIDIWGILDPTPTSLDFSPDGDWMAVGVSGTPTKIHIFNTTTWVVDTNITFSLGACSPGCPTIGSISFSGDSQWMMVAGSDTENDLIYNYIFNTTTWESVKEWFYSSVVADSDIDFSNNSQYIVDSVYDDTKIRVRAIFTVERNASITPVVNSLNEQNNLTFTPTRSYTGNVTLKVPVSNDVGGIIVVRNNTDSINASEVDDKGSLVNNTFWYDSANQFVYIRTINLTTSSTVDWTVNCSHGINFNLIIPSYLEVGQYFQSEGFISNSSGYAITGMIAETRLLYANGTDALSVNPKHNCTGGNYDCRFSTSTLLPGIYSVSIEFTDPTSGIVFKEGGTLYLSVDPGSGIHVSTFLHFTFYNNNTGIGIPSESFKAYASTDTTIDSSDRIYTDLYGVYTGQTIYYRIDDYFDNQIYPTVGTYVTLGITSTNQFEDVPIDWHSFSVKNMNHSIVKFKMTNDSRTYSQYLYPYEPFYWNVLGGTYTINLTYYNPVTDAIVDYHQENITITDDTYYWIRGYDLQDIIIEIQLTNATINALNISITADISFMNSTVNTITTNIISNLTLTESNLTTLINSYSSNYTIIESLISYLNNTMWANFTAVNTTIDTINNKLTIDFGLLNVTVDYLNTSIWTNFTLINTSVNNISFDVSTELILLESNLTTLNNNIWNSINITDSIVTYLNNTVHNVISAVNLTVNYLNNTVWTNFTVINSNIDSMNNTIINTISLSETNLTTLNNNVWNSINITDSVIDYINNTLWNEISLVNVTLDYLNNTIWTNLSLIDSDIDTLSVSVHTSLSASETNISNIIYNVWSSLNISNATIDYLNASIWNNLSFIQSSLNNTNLTITNMILLMENNITSLVITIENIIDFALMPDIVIWSRNPPMVFSVYDKEGMAIGGNIIKICPALITIATTRVETTGNWINSTAQIPYNGTVENGTVTILEDALYVSGSGSISYINITYTDNGTLMQNTTYIPSKINLYGENLTINASGDIHILRETQYHQLYKFYWDYDAITGGHTAGIDIINPMAVPIYDVYVYVEFSNQSTADPTTVVMKDVANDGTVSEHGEDYDISFVGIHFYLLSINASSTRGFTIEYTKQFDDAYRYGEETASIPTYDKTVWNGLSFNTFIVNWANEEDTIFRGALYAKLNFEIPTEINKDSVRIWDDDNNVELDSSSFIPSSGFIRIGANGIGDVSPGGGRSFQVYFLMTVYPGASPSELHLNTQIFWRITPFLIILLVGLILIGYSTYVYIYKEKKDWKNGIVLGVFIIFIFYVMAQMGI